MEAVGYKSRCSSLNHLQLVYVFFFQGFHTVAQYSRFEHTIAIYEGRSKSNKTGITAPFRKSVDKR